MCVFTLSKLQEYVNKNYCPSYYKIVKQIDLNLKNSSKLFSKVLFIDRSQE